MPYERIWPMLNTLRFELEREIPAGAFSVPEREARVFEGILRGIPVGASKAGIISGEMGMEFVRDEERAAWEMRIEAAKIPPEDMRQCPFQKMDALFGFQASDGGKAHSIIDYGRVLSQGLRGVCEHIESEMPGSGKAKRETLGAMHIALKALAEFSRRYAEGNPLCAQVPWEPAKSFAEALQCLWLLNIGIAVSEGSSASISLGRFDQYILGLYRSDIAKGVAKAELETQLADFFRMLNNPEFADAAMNLNLGGVDAEGRSMYNELSRLIVKVASALRLPAPLMAARIYDGIPQDDFDMLCDPELLLVGQPSFYGEEPCRRALAARGVPASEIPNWAANSCMGLMMPAQEWSDMWGSVINMLIPLELAINKGRPFKGELPFVLKTQAHENYRSFEELFETVCDYASELTGLFVEETERRREERGRTHPNPFVSALLDDCIGRGLDKLQGGVRHRTLIVEAFGLINCADALLAIKKLAFDSQEFRLDALAAAAKCDYEGAEGILRRIKALPKYGNADKEADGMAAKLASRFAEAVSSHSTDELSCAPSFHTLNAHVWKGAKTAASLDGRREGESLAKNIGSRPGIASKGHSSLILSATGIDQAKFFGGQALDLSFDPSIFKTKDGRRKFQALLKVYFKRGGLLAQVNGLSPETLRKAMAEPEKHKDLIVRIGGFSLRFTGMPEAAQRDFIARFETGV